MSTELFAKVGSKPREPPKLHLEALNLVALFIGDQLAFQPNIGNLRAGARIRAAIQTDPQGNIQITEALFQFIH